MQLPSGGGTGVGLEVPKEPMSGPDAILDRVNDNMGQSVLSPEGGVRRNDTIQEESAMRMDHGAMRMDHGALR